MRCKRRIGRERRGHQTLSIRRAMFARLRARSDGRLGRKAEREGFDEVESTRAAAKMRQPEQT
jgi:hypothetical protein